jgi:hypothetical protein
MFLSSHFRRGGEASFLVQQTILTFACWQIVRVDFEAQDLLFDCKVISTHLFH